ncbi:hypothetical protein IQ264_03455 [Phormidium sp. LEGE 05292]|uniref:hypothetical protein n=1 Tax=[Phormidium] sp. LEGE 05292 TaxID=767427 RepID=UPI0018807108|nr:hypothetical protein [Phormidium sp. LEGE 05292]MBE9224529.1 hypothetical protein [Phormidium sp. LEGE 05292]
MTKDALPDRLYLLAPWDLPIEQQLSEANEAKLRQALQQLLQALNCSSSQEALNIIIQELANLDISHVFTASVSYTQTSLKPWEVEDFNNYFKLMHVQTKEPEICVIWTLFVAYRTFLSLDESGSNFDAIQVEYLKEGFRQYAYLLARVFSISLEEIK